MPDKRDMLLLKGTRNSLTNEMILIIRVLYAFIRKQDLLKLPGKKGRQSCAEYCNSRGPSSGYGADENPKHESCQGFL
jgi:hypothetical protein